MSRLSFDVSRPLGFCSFQPCVPEGALNWAHKQLEDEFKDPSSQIGYPEDWTISSIAGCTPLMFISRTKECLGQLRKENRVVLKATSIGVLAMVCTVGIPQLNGGHNLLQAVAQHVGPIAWEARICSYDPRTVRYTTPDCPL